MAAIIGILCVHRILTAGERVDDYLSLFSSCFNFIYDGNHFKMG